MTSPSPEEQFEPDPLDLAMVEPRLDTLESALGEVGQQLTTIDTQNDARDRRLFELERSGAEHRGLLERLSGSLDVEVRGWLAGVKTEVDRRLGELDTVLAEWRLGVEARFSDLESQLEALSDRYEQHFKILSDRCEQYQDEIATLDERTGRFGGHAEQLAALDQAMAGLEDRLKGFSARDKKLAQELELVDGRQSELLREMVRKVEPAMAAAAGQISAIAAVLVVQQRALQWMRWLAVGEAGFAATVAIVLVTGLVRWWTF